MGEDPPRPVGSWWIHLKDKDLYAMLGAKCPRCGGRFFRYRFRYPALDEPWPGVDLFGWCPTHEEARITLAGWLEAREVREGYIRFHEETRA